MTQPTKHWWDHIWCRCSANLKHHQIINLSSSSNLSYVSFGNQQQDVKSFSPLVPHAAGCPSAVLWLHPAEAEPKHIPRPAEHRGMQDVHQVSVWMVSLKVEDICDLEQVRCQILAVCSHSKQTGSYWCMCGSCTYSPHCLNLFV